MSRTRQLILGVFMVFAVFDQSARILSPPQVRVDLNGDGRLDLAVVDRKDGIVRVFLSWPDGRLVPNGNYRLAAIPWAIVAGDFDANGSFDLATADGPNGTVSVLLNRGDGNFQLPQSYHMRVLGSCSIEVIDSNADGKPDLVVSDIRGYRSVLVDRGDGTFSGG